MVQAYGQFSEQVQTWCALRTGARWEKSVAEQLLSADVMTYLPLMTRTSRSKSKVQSAEVPLFSGYVFCDMNTFRDNPRIGPACKQKIAQMLVPPDPEQLKNELAAIATVLGSRKLIQERFYGQVGDIVRITGGPFVGSVGEIVRLKPGTSRIVLTISFLGAVVEAVVDESVLDKDLKLSPSSQQIANST